ncbi:CCHC-type zinc finger transcription factor [Phycomyces blakesleeanus NRRL 1555(-)]|uniref:CCHC-type zinc finger transcription factor n=1 Tax=Phycomyces blakesleeanus (strain ATCC 8743b / DSM 1359 / FGSC 10004 / NBRC 33097 / NRRL 1555) TaxID=763407 RepID=A0A162TWT5_PHYB8|nr:CCHC-type zinc finger transcription factor [Phycomyces blakesleeanus NRRL 1555(-)]OAD71602.1 CCHC-type zinc finger transcription factor [Phycomyces blakesleeanus NRRL 1555(-)]|eukprot:XP_018289642.1 CCHC-type zinc finger transcription factor [Phycomyces blakesleeanus NRRL 1555(-)]
MGKTHGRPNTNPIATNPPLPSYAQTASTKPTQVASILFSTLPASPSHVWHESTTPHSIFFNPPIGTPQEDAFWDSLLGSMHLTDSTTCLDICSKGFLVNDERFFPSQGIHTGTKILCLYLTKLPFLPRQVLEQLIKDSLAKYGIVCEIGIHLRHSCFDSTGYAYIERPPSPTILLLPLSYKIPTSDSTHFLATWTRMGSHCTYCRAMGHNIEACPIHPQDSRKCFTCHETGHLQNTCPRTPATESGPSKRSWKLPRTILSAQDPKTHPPPPPAPHPDSAAQSKTAKPLTSSLSETTQPKRTYTTRASPGIETANPFAVLAEIFKAAKSHAAQTQEKSDTNPANSPSTLLYHNLRTAFIPEGSGSSPTILDKEFYESTFGLVKSGNPQTRSHFICYLCSLTLDILALQETHTHTEDLQQTFTLKFQAKDSLWSPHCGLVSVLPFLSFTDSLFSLCHQCITATVVHSSNLSSPFCVCVLYAPATVCPRYDFLTSLLSSPHLVPSKPSQFLMLGDFNYDSHAAAPRVHLAPKSWLQFVANTLVDCITPSLSAPMPTFHHDMSSSTIDYIYASTDLAHCYGSSTVTYVQPLWTDHCLVRTCLHFPTLSNISKGLWRANLRLAHNSSFCSALSHCLTSFVPTLPYNSSLQIQWDLLKQEVARFTCSFSCKSHPSLATLEVKLQSKRDHLIHRFRHQPSQNFQLPIVKRQIQQIQQIQQECIEILALRAGRHWREQGETSAGFLKCTITNRQAHTTITSLRHLTTDTLCTSKEDLTDAAATFYQDLYTPTLLHKLQLTTYSPIYHPPFICLRLPLHLYFYLSHSSTFKLGLAVPPIPAAPALMDSHTRYYN